MPEPGQARVRTAHPTDVGCETLGACRNNSKAVLRDQIERLRRQANNLQILHDTLPGMLTPEQDEAIWNIAVSLNR